MILWIYIEAFENSVFLQMIRKTYHFPIYLYVTACTHMCANGAYMCSLCKFKIIHAMLWRSEDNLSVCCMFHTFGEGDNCSLLFLLAIWPWSLQPRLLLCGFWVSELWFWCLSKIPLPTEFPPSLSNSYILMLFSGFVNILQNKLGVTRCYSYSYECSFSWT